MKIINQNKEAAKKFYKPKNKKKQKERTSKISLLSSSVAGNGAESQREKEREWDSEMFWKRSYVLYVNKKPKRIY